MVDVPHDSGRATFRAVLNPIDQLCQLPGVVRRMFQIEQDEVKSCRTQ